MSLSRIIITAGCVTVKKLIEKHSAPVEENPS